jgi:drug/metabolite transporter (DMT)-like permease
MTKTDSLTRYFFIAAILQIVWGLTPSASRLVIEEIPVELYITIRWSISGIIFSLYLFLTKTWKKIEFADIGFISLLGLLGYGVASFGTLYGLKLGGVTNFALMAALSPIISSLMSVLILKERPQKIFILSLIISILGLVLLLVGKYQISSFSIAGYSALLILMAYICEALVFVYSKKFKRKMDAPQYLAIAQIATAGFMWILQGTTFHQLSQLANLTSKGLGGIIFVSIVACVLCYAVLYWLLNHFDGHKLALFDGLHTLSAVFFGYLFFQEEIRWMMIVGGFLILLALVSGNLPQKKTAAEIPE